MQSDDERKFLHDLAGPLANAMFVLDSLLEELRERADADPDDVAQVERTMSSLEKLKRMLVDRREAIIQRGAASA